MMGMTEEAGRSLELKVDMNLIWILELQRWLIQGILVGKPGGQDAYLSFPPISSLENLVLKAKNPTGANQWALGADSFRVHESMVIL